MRNARGRTPCIRGRANCCRLTHSRCTMRCNMSDYLRPGCAVRYNSVGTARFPTLFARMKVVNIHFPGREKRHGFFTRFCVFVAGCAKGQVGARKKYKAHISKYVRPILKYVRHIFRPLQTRMDKAFPKTRSVQQKSPLSLSAFSRPVSLPQNSAVAYLFIATRLVCSVCVWECELVRNEKCRLSLSDGRHWGVLRRH